MTFSFRMNSDFFQQTNVEHISSEQACAGYFLLELKNVDMWTAG